MTQKSRADTSTSTTVEERPTMVTVWALIGSEDPVGTDLSRREVNAAGLVAYASRREDLPHGGWASKGLHESAVPVDVPQGSREAHAAVENSALWHLDPPRT